MAFQVNLSRQAIKALKKLDPIHRKKTEQSIALLVSNPFLGEKMAGDFQGSYRIKIPPVRIIYKPDLKRKIIWIRAIGPRGGIYKN